MSANFSLAGASVPLCQSLRVGARSVWSGTELGGAGELALMFEPEEPCAVQRKVSGETRTAESGGRALAEASLANGEARATWQGREGGPT